MKRRIEEGTQESAPKKAKIEFYEAVNNNNLTIVKAYLNDPAFEPQRLEKAALVTACIMGYHEIVNVLLRDERFRDQLNITQLINMACTEGHILVLKRLINDPLESGDINDGFIMACKNGHFNVVQLLIENGLVSPSCCNNKAIEWAAASGHYEILDYLMQFPEVNPADSNNLALKRAFDNGFLNKGQEACALRLLKDPRVQATNTEFEKACEYNMSQLVTEMLDSDTEWKITSFTLHRMYERSSFQTVNVLLTSPKVNTELKEQINLALDQIQDKFGQQFSFLFFAKTNRDEDTSHLAQFPDEIIDNIERLYAQTI